MSRLNRLSNEQTELALSLYRDAPLVKTILLLSTWTFPETVRRFAVSLDHPTEGPFVIITSTGHFVTCLARGMRPSQRSIITRAQLDATRAYVADLRAWMNTTAQLSRE